MSQQTLVLKLELLGDAVFGRGDGVAGLIDQDVAHDALGLPFLHGRGVKGLLRARCQEVLSALELALPPNRMHVFRQAEAYLFGRPGSDLHADAALAFGPACLSEELARALAPLIAKGRLTPHDTLTALTYIRRQTRIDESTGAAKEDTLRSVRVLRSGLVFRAPIYAPAEWAPCARGLLAAGVMAVRRVGARRARGMGQARAALIQNGRDVTFEWLGEFEKELA